MNSRIILLLTGALFLQGCAQLLPPQPDDPYYAPAIILPEQPDNIQAQTGAIYSLNNANFLYSDRKAARIGDLVTVQLNERTNASKNADTEIKKKDKDDFSAPLISGRIPSFNGNPLSYDLSTDRNFKAETDSEQANSLNGTITVTVAQVLHNGNLLIKGEKWLTLNQGNEFIRVTGIIRPEDISTDNTISSTRVANARITYSGTGQLDESNKMGWLSRFFNSSWFPI